MEEALAMGVDSRFPKIDS
jgi:hypothetical protein